MWLEANTLMLSPGANVTSWLDQSGNGNDASILSPDVPPTYNASSINGLPAVAFNGMQRMYVPTLTPSGTISLFTVVKVVSSTGDQHYISCYNGGSGGGGLGNFSGNFHIFVTSGGSLVVNLFSVALSVTNHILDLQVDGTNASGYVDSSQIYNTACGAMSPGTVLYLGGAFNGSLATAEIAEILYYNPVISTGNATLVRNYLSAKYGI